MELQAFPSLEPAAPGRIRLRKRGLLPSSCSLGLRLSQSCQEIIHKKLTPSQGPILSHTDTRPEPRPPDPSDLVLLLLLEPDRACEIRPAQPRKSMLADVCLPSKCHRQLPKRSSTIRWWAFIYLVYVWTSRVSKDTTWAHIIGPIHRKGKQTHRGEMTSPRSQQTTEGG